MKFAFYGGQTAGIITLLSLLSEKHEVRFLFPQDSQISEVADLFSLRSVNLTYLDTPQFIKEMSREIDVFICCHGRKILSAELVKKIPCINLHPCLYKYKGSDPIKRLIADKNSRASVASHWMIPEVDAGEVLLEEFITIEDIETKKEADIYRELYPLYIKVLLNTLVKIQKNSALL